VARITSRIHSLDRLEHPFGIYITPYIVEERPEQLTLVDTCFLTSVTDLENCIHDEGYELKHVKNLILTHCHVDHTQAVGEVRRLTGASVYSHWSEAGYLRNDPPYHGPPSHQAVSRILDRLGIGMDGVTKKFGSLSRDPIFVEHLLSDGDKIGNLRVIHTPGHTPGHISLYSEVDRAVIGGDFLFNGIMGEEGLFLFSDVSIDTTVAAVSARRIAQLHFDKLLLGHQREPLIDKSAPEAVEKAATATLTNSKRILVGTS
jgi:glyoxylase-like metal-dependent hydrolase (beta-lactamase superfamily II)